MYRYLKTSVYPRYASLDSVFEKSKEAKPQDYIIWCKKNIWQNSVSIDDTSFSKLRIEEILLKPIKRIYKKPTSNITSYVENWILFHSDQEQSKDVHSYYYSTSHWKSELVQ